MPKKQGLSAQAYEELKPGQVYDPYVSPEVGGDVGGAARHRLHPRTADCGDHGRRRAAVVGGDHPAHRAVRRRPSGPSLPGDGAHHRRDGARSDLDSVCALYRCRGGRHRRSALRYLAEKWASSKEEVDERRERGVLFGSGLVGGEGLLGVAIAIATGVGVQYYGLDGTPWEIGPEWAGGAAQPLAAGLMALLIFGFWRLSCRRD